MKGRKTEMTQRTVEMQDPNLFFTSVTKKDKNTAVAVVQQALLREWFPTNIPVDIQKWERIAAQDAIVAVESLVDSGVLVLEGESK